MREDMVEGEGTGGIAGLAADDAVLREGLLASDGVERHASGLAEQVLHQQTLSVRHGSIVFIRGAAGPVLFEKRMVGGRLCQRGPLGTAAPHLPLSRRPRKHH